ncbi:glycosyltransferase family 9 protein [Silvibacterium bohemicum]|nr:glycosyltransferase family 9 protein [Silvibacterium bohemicum]
MEEKQLRVLIVRLGAMGDILHALPAVTALRQAHPEWFLGWAVEPQWRGLLCADDCKERGPAMPLVDQIHLVPAKQWARAPLQAQTFRAVRQLRRELGTAHYDICLDLQGAVRSAAIARWARAARLIGEDQPREPLARWFFSERVPTQGRHVIEQAIEVVNQVAGESLPYAPAWLPADQKAECNADKLAQPFVLLNPGAGWGAKRWPIDRYATVARALHSLGYTIVVNAGPGEEALGTELRNIAGEFVQTVQPTLTELIAITRRAALVIAGDTGPLHLASALGKPVVAIFGPTDPARNGPFGGSFRVLRHPESKRDHTRRSEPEAGLLTIPPAAVIEAAKELLQELR